MESAVNPKQEIGLDIGKLTIQAKKLLSYKKVVLLLTLTVATGETSLKPRSKD